MTIPRGLGCVEFAVPGRDPEEKLEALETNGMWLELVNDESGEHLSHVLDVLPSFRTPVKSVQAYLLHDLRMLGLAEESRAATRHVEDTIKIASKLGAENVVTVATYGEPETENPRASCIELFRRFGKLGMEYGITISIEALNRKRTTFLPSLHEISVLAEEVGMENVRPMADTFHVHENGEDVVKTIGGWAGKISELHLRDTGSRAPGRGKMDFASLLRAIKGKFRGLMCLEYEPGPDPHAEFSHTLNFLSDIISGAR